MRILRILTHTSHLTSHDLCRRLLWIESQQTFPWLSLLGSSVLCVHGKAVFMCAEKEEYRRSRRKFEFFLFSPFSPSVRMFLMVCAWAYANGLGRYHANKFSFPRSYYTHYEDIFVKEKFDFSGKETKNWWKFAFLRQINRNLREASIYCVARWLVQFNNYTIKLFIT